MITPLVLASDPVGLNMKILLWIFCAGCVSVMTYANKRGILPYTDATPLYAGLIVMLLASILTVMYV